MLCFITSFFLLFTSASEPAAYYQLDYKNFYQLTEVNANVDWAKPNLPLLDAAIFQCTNEQRTLKGKKLFKYAEDLNKSASYHSGSMVKYNFFSHTNNFEKPMKAFYQRMKYFGGSFNGCAENIAYSEYEDGYSYLEVAKDIVQMWMDSEGHRENLMNTTYYELGCGTCVKKSNSFYRVYATQDFGGHRN